MRAERKLFKNLNVQLTDLSDAIAFVESYAEPPARTQQAFGQQPRGSVSKKPQNTMDLMIERFVEVIAFECEVDGSDLRDSTTYEDLSVDSLMQVAIVGRMREGFELRLDISFFKK